MSPPASLPRGSYKANPATPVRGRAMAGLPTMTQCSQEPSPPPMERLSPLLPSSSLPFPIRPHRPTWSIALTKDNWDTSK